MTTAIYRYCSNPYNIPKLYSSARCVVEGIKSNRVLIRLLEFTRTHRPGDRLQVMRKNITITGEPVRPPERVFKNADRNTVRLPYKDN
jgi:hypothetical protein